MPYLSKKHQEVVSAYETIILLFIIIFFSFFLLVRGGGRLGKTRTILKKEIKRKKNTSLPYMEILSNRNQDPPKDFPFFKEPHFINSVSWDGIMAVGSRYLSTEVWLIRHWQSLQNWILTTFFLPSLQQYYLTYCYRRY